jgi:hypothetical protein
VLFIWRINVNRFRARFVACGAVAALLLTMLTIFVSAVPAQRAFADDGTPAANPTNTITIQRFACPPNLDANDLESLVSACTKDASSGTAFTETGADGVAHKATADNGTVSFSVATGATVEIAESLPAGFVSASAFCGNVTGGDVSISHIDAPGGASNIALNSGYDLFCDWFDIPQTVTSVRVLKYDCPATVDPATLGKATESTREAPVCAPQPKVGFTFIDSAVGSPIPMETNANGAAAWDPVPAGDDLIAETLPSGYSDNPVVMCAIGFPKDQPGVKPIPVSKGDYGPTIAFSLLPGQEANCVWYNIKSPATPTPAPTKTATAGNGGNKTSGNGYPTATPNPNAPASLALTVYSCQPGYNIFAATAKPSVDCPNVSAKVAFTLTGDPKLNKKQATDAQGKTTFGNLKPGVYGLTLTFPTGVTSAFIDKCTSNVRDFSSYPFSPFARVGTSGRLGVTLKPGEKMACTWYDVPSKAAVSAATPSAANTAAGGTTVTISLRACPSTSAALAQCAPGPSEVQFTLKPSGGAGQAASVATGADGVATTQIPPGTYVLEELGANWCLADSAAFDAKGNFVVAGDTVTATIYNCGK